MLYKVFELNHAAVSPLRAAAAIGKASLSHPLNPFTNTVFGKSLSAGFEVFENITRRYAKPAFNLPETMINGQPVPIIERDVWSDTFCTLKRFERDPDVLAALHPQGKDYIDPKVLIIAPMSGHYATLLRGTVEAMLPEHDVYITDWTDARMAPLHDGTFGLSEFTDYIISMLQHLGPNTHVIAVCQPGPAALAATALMAEDKDPAVPASLTIMGSPIDARRSPTVPNNLAMENDFSWFENNVIMSVPWPHAGFGRRVYPGFIQLSSFMAMNHDRHVDAHNKYFHNLIAGDGDSTARHREFYEEYLAVMDLTAEFYLETIDKVFQRHLLAKGEMDHHGRIVDTSAITTTALLTVEGEKDDISGIGQTQAAHDLCTNIPQDMRLDYVQPGVGHYGVFNGKRWQTEIQPRVRDFIRSHDHVLGGKA